MEGRLGVPVAVANYIYKCQSVPARLCRMILGVNWRCPVRTLHDFGSRRKSATRRQRTNTRAIGSDGHGSAYPRHIDEAITLVRRS
jgi:hypothetical protein